MGPNVAGMFIKKIEMFTDGRQMPSDGNTNVAHLT
jgi:hypothetical protein